ncbi:hypothetical protein SLEP1_g50421 [Rubroshorea leprosula]|uniref:Uncharacterized protein n=1 Tax=Rubroshorea leprosula TaxID=152421 RepID=A0AAV5M2B0_9ROSI|nr:hypothetical protein SLEP1_g50421 [Rubroshorea leprosula]
MVKEERKLRVHESCRMLGFEEFKRVPNSSIQFTNLVKKACSNTKEVK